MSVTVSGVDPLNPLNVIVHDPGVGDAIALTVNDVPDPEIVANELQAGGVETRIGLLNGDCV